MNPTFKKTLLTSLALTALSPSTRIIAQTEVEQDTIEVIQVTSFRDSIIRAKDLKRESMISQDSIVAEDITDFPDLNLADALQRVPGVTITREAGEGRQISLRGLGPDFTRVQVNGMEALGTSSSPMDARGGVSRTRAFDFNIFAAELFNRIDVKKSYSADQDEGGIGGTVNLHTAKPFDYQGFESAISVQGGYNTNTEQTDPRFAALISNRGEHWGALISVAYSERETREYGTNTTRWRQETGKVAADPGNTELQEQLDSGKLWFPRGHRYSLWNNQQKRLGITSSLQFKPSDTLTLSLDAMHGQLENTLNEHHMAVKDNQIVHDLEFIDNNGDKEVIYAHYQDATWRAENRADYNESTFSQVTLSADWRLTDDLAIKAMVGRSTSDYDQPQVHKLNVHAPKQVDIITDFRDDRFYGHSYSPNFDMASLDGFEVKDLYFQEDYISSDFDNAKLDIEYFLTDHGILQVGANYKKFSNEGHQRVASNFPTNPDTPLNQGNFNLTDELSQIFHQHPDTNWIEGDLERLQAFYGLTGYRLGEEAIIETSDFRVTEKTSAVYGQYHWENFVAGKLFRASIGARYFETELTSVGISQGEPTDLTRSYSGVLPSLNIAYEVSEDVLWRFGASKNVTRPSLSALAFSANVSQTSLDEGDIGTINIGNPHLDPFESVNLDTAIEWYFEDVGFLSAALFYKDIDNFIVSETQQIVYSDLALPERLLPEGKTPDDIFNVTSPQNSDSSSIKGVELAFSRDFDFLPAPFDNLGMIANYTWADGNTLYRNVQNTGRDEVKAFAGLSRHSYNLTFYYEQENWGGRISAAYRSAYITDVPAGNGDHDEMGYHATTYVDFSSFYQLAENVKLKFEALNLTNVRDQLYSDSNDRAYNTTSSGRTYMVGISARF